MALHRFPKLCRLLFLLFLHFHLPVIPLVTILTRYIVLVGGQIKENLVVLQLMLEHHKIKQLLVFGKQ